MELGKKVMQFFGNLNSVRTFGDLVYLFQSQTVAVQWLLGLASFGILVLVWIFVVAIFIDKHN